MPAEIRIYFEGDRSLRKGFRDFFDELYRNGLRIRLIPCGANAIENFMKGIKRNPQATNVLVKDSDEPFSERLFQRVRQDDHWDAAIGRRVSNDTIHFMVQVMESWFLADQAALQTYYDQGFAAGRLPANSAVEQIPKDEVNRCLAAATRDTRKGRYHKTNHAPELLSVLNPAVVRAACPSCDRIFNTLAQLTD